MTLADLWILACFWLLLACLRLRLRIDPRYRGKRRHGSGQTGPALTGSREPIVVPGTPPPFRIAPYVAPVGDLDPDETGPVLLDHTEPLILPTTYVSLGRGVEPLRGRDAT